MKILWDPIEARSNRRKHAVSFSDAQGVFFDPCAVSMEDPETRGEQRHVAIGRDSLGRVITIVCACRAGNIRTISARKATGAETSTYEKGIRLQ